MRWILCALLCVALISDSRAHRPDPLCVLDAAGMPEAWRPSPELQQSTSAAPWSKSEAEDAERSVERGVDEMIGYLRSNPSAVPKLFDDSVAALLQVTYASANKPQLDAKALDAARDNLTALLEPYRKRDPGTATCDEFEALLPLAIFAHRLYAGEHTLTDVVTKRTNAAYRDCGSLEEATDDILRKVVAGTRARLFGLGRLEQLFDLYYWALLLIEAELYPQIVLPAEAREFGHAAWKYFASYRLAGAGEFAKGVEDERFIALADLVTHIAHIPTGIHRFPLYVDDMPGLYRFLRESFYPLMQSGDRDLFALLVDTLRQYGCTPENDRQVRDGARHLLASFHRGGDRWMSYREARRSLADPIEYVKTHHAWTAVLGMRERKLQRPGPGTYGSIVRRWLPDPR
jgi:hypothetical protein